MTQINKVAGDNSIKELYSEFFVDPCGDLHRCKPIAAIWVKEIHKGWFRRALFEVHLDFEDGEGWVYDFPTQKEAKEYRDKLIEGVS